MSHPTKATQLTIRSSNLPDSEERALAVLTKNAIKVYGTRSYGPVVDRVIMIAVDDGPKAHHILETERFDCQSVTQVLLAPASGVLQKYQLIAELTRAGIGVLYSYSLLPRESEIYLVIKSRDDEHALKILDCQYARKAA